MRKSSDTVKKVSLELGGHAPVVVFESADLEKAVNSCLSVKFRFMGQVSIYFSCSIIYISINELFCLFALCTFSLSSPHIQT